MLTISYPSPHDNPRVIRSVGAVSSESATVESVIYWGSDEGMVYQADKGSSFDGEEIEAFLILPFNNSKSPTVLKSYMKATLEMTSEIYSSFNFSIDFSYGDLDQAQHANPGALTVTTSGGLWDVDNWDEFFYDSAFLVDTPSFQISGSGSNMSIVVHSNTDYDFGHTVDVFLLQYIPRRPIR
jgi:hypothetical protein